jgi:SAM-dependent methyltransferase
MHDTSIALFTLHAIPHFAEGMDVLEMGPDGVPSTYCRLLKGAGRSVNWYFADSYSDGSPVAQRVSMTSPYDIDAPAERFDIVFHGQVLEHVAKIWRWLPETARVLRTGGRMIIINPAAWHFHACPIDCWRAYPDGMRSLLEDCGIRCDTSMLCEYADGTADTISIGVKIGPPAIRFEAVPPHNDMRTSG